ncbi:hypothetical protein PHACT_00135 [Pseudohongiella acticola]|uniref:Methyltransferase type 11 domain-containing protein n=1 Tax=Pseudohongiella acticola TaxID=1524254 RepID=A0A1E8CH83_9GAMM|nr:methyltransferase domain-containing protein [Pseudohongiella acticola]OFE11759.1 hypothetical protein PHACT_00135 [Pseudohongiella acticola]
MKKIVKKVKWSLRRLRLKIPKEALVLEVGSGGNPYPRANVLLDAYEDTQERHWEELVHDRPTVLSFGENLPFKDKAFDFVVAAHVLEHTPFPEKFLHELQRVACAGYIETPDAFMERINPYMDHRLEVTLRDGSLVIFKKASWLNEPELVELYEARAKKIITQETIPQHAEEFHMRYHWKDKIDFKVVDPEIDATWDPPSKKNVISALSNGPRYKLRKLALIFISRIFSQNRRNAKLDVISLMRCPECISEDLARKSLSEVVCKNCSSSYKVDDMVYKLYNGNSSI